MMLKDQNTKILNRQVPDNYHQKLEKRVKKHRYPRLINLSVKKLTKAVSSRQYLNIQEMPILEKSRNKIVVAKAKN